MLAVGQLRDCAHVGRAHHSLVMLGQKRAAEHYQQSCVVGACVAAAPREEELRPRADPCLLRAALPLAAHATYMGKVCSISTVANAQRRALAKRAAQLRVCTQNNLTPTSAKRQVIFHHCADIGQKRFNRAEIFDRNDIFFSSCNYWPFPILCLHHLTSGKRN